MQISIDQDFSHRINPEINKKIALKRILKLVDLEEDSHRMEIISTFKMKGILNAIMKKKIASRSRFCYGILNNYQPQKRTYISLLSLEFLFMCFFHSAVAFTECLPAFKIIIQYLQFEDLIQLKHVCKIYNSPQF